MRESFKPLCRTLLLVSLALGGCSRSREQYEVSFTGGIEGSQGMIIRKEVITLPGDKGTEQYVVISVAQFQSIDSDVRTCAGLVRLFPALMTVQRGDHVNLTCHRTPTTARSNAVSDTIAELAVTKWLR